MIIFLVNTLLFLLFSYENVNVFHLITFSALHPLFIKQEQIFSFMPGSML